MREARWDVQSRSPWPLEQFDKLTASDKVAVAHVVERVRRVGNVALHLEAAQVLWATQLVLKEVNIHRSATGRVRVLPAARVLRQGVRLEAGRRQGRGGAVEQRQPHRCDTLGLNLLNIDGLTTTTEKEQRPANQRPTWSA